MDNFKDYASDERCDDVARKIMDIVVKLPLTVDQMEQLAHEINDLVHDEIKLAGDVIFKELRASIRGN